MSDLANILATLAQSALYEELNTYPKAGLVSHIDNGSHQDMNYATFILGIQSLNDYFLKAARAGGDDKDFTYLEYLGLEAEDCMLKATGNINTHRGAIFILGLLIAVCGHCLTNKITYDKISITINNLYGKGLAKHKTKQDSHGNLVRQKYKLEGIIDAAITGFPLIFSALKQYKFFLQNKMNAKLLTFFYIMQHLDDTNLVYRGGIDGLYYAKEQASMILKNPHLLDKMALELHHEFIRRNLSPGGSADILSAVIFLAKAEKIWD